MSPWPQLLLMLIIILIAAQLFSNALEYFGERVGISSGVIGSIFAAISTALPETTIPILALLAGTSDKHTNEEISVGAILGAPLMLSTLSIFIMALFVIRKRTLFGKICPEETGFKRDLNFFIMSFFIAAAAMFVPLEPVYPRAAISILLVSLYITYVFLTFRASNNLVKKGHGITISEPLFMTKLGLSNNMTTILIQLVLGFVLLILGAKGFINNVVDASHALGISTLLLSLLIIPLATEFPEKVNSVLWVRKNKDTLGVGNITGAMVFQGTLLPAIGILLTPWQPNKIVLTGVVIAFMAAVWLRLSISKKGLAIASLFLNGLLYVVYLCLVFL